MKPGVAFPDFISTGKRSRHKDNDFGYKRFSPRGFLMPVLLLFFVSIFLVRLFYLQVVSGIYYRNLSDSNRIRTSIIHAPRGIIFDRNNIPLVFNIPGFRKVENGHTRLISREKALTLIAQGEKGLEVDALRQYPYTESLSHVLGFIGQISKKELSQLFYQTYHSGDLIGKMGIEQEYEEKLTGIDGKKLIEVDSMGKTIRTLGQTDPIPGHDIYLTIDSKLQKAAYEALKNVKRGVVIVSTPKGEILVLVSKPAFDPNLFTLDETYKVSSDAVYRSVSEVLEDSQNQPFLNRAISGVYPPGSTFKLITAASALENHIIDANYEIEDTGIMHVGAFSFANWYYTQYGKTEGLVNIEKAIKRSNDIFFYKLAEKVGVETLSETAKNFGLGKRLGIDIEGEVSGTVPTPLWKEKIIGESWYLGDTYHYGIGQGYVLTTPLQVNGWTQVIANKGVLYTPYLLRNLGRKIMNPHIARGTTIQPIVHGMTQSCSTGGVAWPLFEFRIKNLELRKKIDNKNFFEVSQATNSANFKDWVKVSIACKTGTAQHGGEQTLPHAWITLFAPVENPQVVITVLAESSGEGSNIAAPVAKKVLEEWFSR